MKKFAVILSGCGVYDGSEIHEAVMAMYAITRAGAEYSIFAPDIQQFHVINHITGKEMNESRNVLIESARIARGKISTLGEFIAEDFDAVVLPGGYGAAKNLSTYAFDGDKMIVNPEIESVLKTMHKLKKPIGAMCIAPLILAKIFGNVELTIGQDEGTTKTVEALGAVHYKTVNGQVVVDEKNKIVTTPCYMLDASIADVAEGAEKLVKAMLLII